MNRNTLYISIALIVLVLANSFFIVQQRTQALVFQFGEVVKTVKEPGLSFKLPFLQSVDFFDLRLLNFVAAEKEVVASDQKRLIVSAFAKYKIDPMMERLDDIFETILMLQKGKKNYYLVKAV